VPRYKRDVAELKSRAICSKEQKFLKWFKEKSLYGFAMRRRSIEHVGFSRGRTHRMKLLEVENRFHQQLASESEFIPEISPLLLVRVEGS
jgi:hypothetical protein